MLGKTLDMSGGTLTLSNEQKLDIIQTTESNVDFGLYDVRASTFTADELTAGRVVFTGTDGLLSDSDIDTIGEFVKAGLPQWFQNLQQI